MTFVLFFGEVYSLEFHALAVEFQPVFLWLERNLVFMIPFTCQVIPQAICTRYGLAVGANFVWLVRILMVICYPISYPIGKVNSMSDS